MRYSRYRVNYILWAVYGLVICIYFTVQTSLVCSMLGLGWMFYFLGTAGCAFLLILLVYLPIRTLAGMKSREKQCMPRSSRRSYVQEGARHAQLWECLFLIFAIAAALALRLWSCLVTNLFMKSRRLRPADIMDWRESISGLFFCICLPDCFPGWEYGKIPVFFFRSDSR